MHAIRTTALTLIAIFACLMLLRVPEPQPGEIPVQISAPVKQDQVTRFESAEVVTSDQLALTERDLTSQAFVIAIPEQTTELSLVWHPELEQIRQLENAPVTEAVFELRPLLANEDPVIRLAAIESLGDMTTRATLPALSAALSDPNPQLRIAALEALASQEDESVLSSIEHYLYDQNRNVRVAAIEALADLEIESAVHALSGLLSDQDSLIRHNAVSALGEIGGENAMMYLLQARYDPNSTIRANADAILAESQYKAAY
jgi:HEAT repeat protein